eukprot:6213019-Pleurochrysis_carterae.AAC.1
MRPRLRFDEAREECGRGDGVVDEGGLAPCHGGGVDVELREERLVDLPLGRQRGVEGARAQPRPLAHKSAPELAAVGRARRHDAHAAVHRLGGGRREAAQVRLIKAVGEAPERGGLAPEHALRHGQLEQRRVRCADSHDEHHIDPGDAERADDAAEALALLLKGKSAYVHRTARLAVLEQRLPEPFAVRARLVEHGGCAEAHLLLPKGAGGIPKRVVARHRAHEARITLQRGKKRRGRCVGDSRDVLQARKCGNRQRSCRYLGPDDDIHTAVPLKPPQHGAHCLQARAPRIVQRN